jgi:hypothetical protein
MAKSQAEIQKAYRERHRDELRVRTTKWRESHKKEARQANRNWKAANPEKSKEGERKQNAKHRDKAYGKGAQTHFEQQKLIQDGKCAICERVFYSSRGTHLDHNHITGQWRGALCAICNESIWILEDAEMLAKSKAYLKNWNQQVSAQGGK